MKTADFAATLARQSLPVAPRAAGRTLGAGMAAAVPVAVALMALLLGVRPDIVNALAMPMFWVKLLAPLALALAAGFAIERLARPGMPLRRGGAGALLLPVAVLWLLGAWVWGESPPDARWRMLFGPTWRVCPANIALLSLPVLVAALAALRHLAPTRPAVAGAVAGAMAGGAGAAVYALHCPEMFAPFLAVWYVLGMALPVVAGALLGPRLLRW